MSTCPDGHVEVEGVTSRPRLAPRETQPIAPNGDIQALEWWTSSPLFALDRKRGGPKNEVTRPWRMTRVQRQHERSSGDAVAARNGLWVTLRCRPCCAATVEPEYTTRVLTWWPFDTGRCTGLAVHGLITPHGQIFLSDDKSSVWSGLSHFGSPYCSST